LALVLTCTAARAASVLEQAQLKVFFMDSYLSAMVEACVQKQPELRQKLQANQQAVRRRMRIDIDIGREVGRSLFAPQGKDVDQEAKRFTEQQLTSQLLAEPDSRQQKFCEELSQPKTLSRWSMDHFLRQDFESLKMQVENSQGLPCDMIATSFEWPAKQFLELPSTPAEVRDVASLLLHSNISALEKKTSNCLALNARAAEYRVAPDKELEVIAALLSSMRAALTPIWDSRPKNNESVGIVSERVGEYLRQRAK